MSRCPESSTLAALCVEHIRNRTETRVLSSMARLLPELDDGSLTDKDKCDIYALACNSLPSSYAQPGTIILGRLSEAKVEAAVRTAYENVVQNPKK